MNEDLKQRWIAALESGDYPKSVGRLRDSVGFCCLGVLGDLLIQEDHSYHWSQDAPRTYFLITPSGARGSCLEEIVLPISDQDSLAQINDQTDTFHDVTIWIKENL